MYISVDVDSQQFCIKDLVTHHFLSVSSNLLTVLPYHTKSHTFLFFLFSLVYHVKKFYETYIYINKLT